MTDEKTSLSDTPPNNSFYTGQESSTGEFGSSGVARRVLHGLTLISVLIAGGCTIYASIQVKSAVFLLTFLIVIIWLFIHIVLLVFAHNDQHDFHPPAWFIFVSSGQIFIQSLVVIILTL